MKFEWDEDKSVRNARKRGLPFEFAVPMFDGPCLEVSDDRQDYGETRIKALGVVSGRVLVCLYTWRGGNRRIISLRKANRKEADEYDRTFPG